MRPVPAMTTASSYYRLNERVFWPLALLCLWQAWRSRAIEGAVSCSSAVLKERSLLLLVVVLLLLGAWALRRRLCLRRQQGAEEAGAVPPPRVEGKARGRRQVLEAFCAEQQRRRQSPHVLGHGKARLGRVAAAVAKAGRDGSPSGMSLRGDWLVGGGHEQPRHHNALEVLLPLRLPPGIRLRVAPSKGPQGVFTCTLEVSFDKDGAGVEALCVEGPRHGPCLSSALTLRWFAAQLKRSLRAMRCGPEERPSLEAGPGRPPVLRLGPCSDDYVCSHLCLCLRLAPALPVSKGLFLTPLPGRQGALWTLDASRLERRMWGWVRERAPHDACHLRCLRILEGLRDVVADALAPPLCDQWSRALRSEVLDTALLRLLLQRGPGGRWGGRRLEERLGELVAFLVGALRGRRLAHLFLGSEARRLPPALGLPRMLTEAAPVNLLAGFEEPSLDQVALRLWDAWQRAGTLLGAGGRTHPH